MAFQLLQNMASGHIKVKKGTGYVFYMATPSNSTESVWPLGPQFTHTHYLMHIPYTFHAKCMGWRQRAKCTCPEGVH